MEKEEHLIELCEKACKYLQNNFHPNTTVVIEVDSIRVEETLINRIIKYDVD